MYYGHSTCRAEHGPGTGAVHICVYIYIYIYISKGLRHSADPLEFRIGGQWGAAQVAGLGWSGVEWKGVFSIEMVRIGVE